MATPSQKIVPNLWFDSNAEEAVDFYTSAFGNSSKGFVARYGKEGFEFHGKPEGSVMTIDFTLGGFRFIAINGGPFFKFTPAISFFVTCETEEEVDKLWNRLSEGGVALMALDRYPWSEKYGWVQDKFGVTWQLSLGKLSDAGNQKIVPLLMYVGNEAVRAEEAIKHYTSVFDNSSIVGILHYDENDQDKPENIKHAQFKLNGETFMAMGSSYPHAFGFTEAISLMVNCESQKEIDHFWDKLSEGGDPQAQQCGWLKDKFGVSWQVAPTELNRMLEHGTPEQVARVTNAYMQMKKFDLAELERAYNG